MKSLLLASLLIGICFIVLWQQQSKIHQKIERLERERIVDRLGPPAYERTSVKIKDRTENEQGESLDSTGGSEAAMPAWILENGKEEEKANNAIASPLEEAIDVEEQQEEEARNAPTTTNPTAVVTEPISTTRLPTSTVMHDVQQVGLGNTTTTPAPTTTAYVAPSTANTGGIVILWALIGMGLFAIIGYCIYRNVLGKQTDTESEDEQPKQKPPPKKPRTSTSKQQKPPETRSMSKLRRDYSDTLQQIRQHQELSSPQRHSEAISKEMLDQHSRIQHFLRTRSPVDHT